MRSGLGRGLGRGHQKTGGYPQPTAEPTDWVTWYRTGSFLYIRSRLNATRDVLYRILVTHRLGAEPDGVYDVPIANADNSITGNFRRAIQSDDSAPIRANDWYVAGNHGFPRAIKMAVSGHGLSFDSIGTVWTLSGKEYALISIFDANNLIFLGRDLSVDGIWNIEVPGTGSRTFTLKDSSPAVTVAGTVSYVQMNTIEAKVHGSYRVRNSVFINGTDVPTVDQAGRCNSVVCYSDYNFINPPAIRAYCVGTNPTNAIGGSSMTANVGQTDIAELDAWAVVKNKQTYKGFGSKVTESSVQFKYNTNLGYVGMHQFDPMNYLDDGFTQFIYAPRVTPTTPAYYDKRELDFTSYSTDRTLGDSHMDAGSMYADAVKKWVDRIVLLAKNGDDDYSVGWAHGYLPLLDATQAKREANSTYAINVFSTRKCYPRIADSKLGTIEADTKFECVWYSQLFNPLQFGNCKCYFMGHGSDYYMYLDSHATISNEVITLPSHLWGRSITVLDRTVNFTLHAGSKTKETIAVSCDCSVEASGYAILKLT